MDKPLITIKLVREILYIIVLLRQGKYYIKILDLPKLAIQKIDQLTEVFGKDTSIAQIDQLKYLLCAAFDEAYFMNAKTQLNNKNTKSLVSYYYNEELSGENFFQILAQLSKNPTRNAALLELGYLIICLGFAGKYAIKENGKNELNALQAKIYSLLTTKPINLISPLFISDVYSAQPQRKSKVKLLAIILLPTIVVGFIYGFFSQELAKESDRLHKLIEQTYNV